MTDADGKRDWQDWVLIGITTVSIVGFLTITVIGLKTLTSSNASREQTTAINENGKVADCKSIFRGPYDAADVALDNAKNVRDTAYLDGQVASAKGDEIAIKRLLELAPIVRKAANDAVEAKDKARIEYNQKVTLAQSNRVKFLRECERFRLHPISSKPMFYSSCLAARNDHAHLPLIAGQRGYSLALDADGDGLACE
jgi:hypothetical protein